MKRAQLIEKAAKAMADANPEAEWEDLSATERGWYRRDARAALAVFEEAHAPTPCPVCHRADGSHKLDCRPQNRRDAAHAPTDDEREALGQALWDALRAKINRPPNPGMVEHLRDRILAAGFRRTVQGEPTERLMQAPEIQAVREYLEQLEDWEAQDHVIEEIRSLVDDIPDCVSATALPHDEHSEPQAEPTDALDLDALEAKAKAATPGPWMLDGMGEDEPEVNYWAHRFVGTAEPNEAGSHEIIATSEDGHGPNAEYIAAADPKTILAMIAALRAAAVEGGETR